jgi:hypothetical protein
MQKNMFGGSMRAEIAQSASFHAFIAQPRPSDPLGTQSLRNFYIYQAQCTWEWISTRLRGVILMGR